MIEQRIVEALHLAQTGSKQEIQAKALKAVLDAVKADGFQDIPLSATPEAHVEIKRFSDQAREALTKEDHAIYTLTGQSIKDQMAADRKFWYVSVVESVKMLPSRTTEVAFNPDPEKFFLTKSNNRTLEQQLAMIADYSKKLQRKLKTQEVEAIMGQVSDYTAVIFAHLDATSKRLFGADYGHNYARTQTSDVESDVANVGNFNDVYGPHVHDWDRGHGHDDVFAVPLVVPK